MRGRREGSRSNDKEFSFATLIAPLILVNASCPQQTPSVSQSLEEWVSGGWQTTCTYSAPTQPEGETLSHTHTQTFAQDKHSLYIVILTDTLINKYFEIPLRVSISSVAAAASVAKKNKTEEETLPFPSSWKVSSVVFSFFLRIKQINTTYAEERTRATLRSNEQEATFA